MPKHRIILSLCLMLALLVVQIAGLHFHVHAAAPWNDALLPAVVHAEHSDTHHSSHEDTAAIDLPVVGFWKSADQGSNFLALLTVAFALLLVTRSRIVLRTRLETRPRFHRPVFLRPPLRAPPR
ncbi:MAG: hypothetical protein H0V62_09290 [Gammaproteobacteria bacterium]|nr:hypothetical protein [Gammaproteobacteria bacterium]